MKFLIPFILLTGSLFGQTAVYNNYSSTVKGMTVGTHYCYFWFHASVNSTIYNQGWDFEVACYEGSTNVVLHFKKAGQVTDQGYEFLNGYIRFIVKPNASDSSKYDFSLAGKGPDDTTDLLVATQTL